MHLEEPVFTENWLCLRNILDKSYWSLLALYCSTKKSGKLRNLNLFYYFHFVISSSFSYCRMVVHILKIKWKAIIKNTFFTKYTHKMDKEFLKFENIEIKKLKFYPYKIPISIKDVDIDKSTVSDKFS